MSCKFCYYSDDDMKCPNCGVKICFECSKENQAKKRYCNHCLKTAIDNTMPFGKHQGKDISTLPASYIYWAVNLPDIKEKWPRVYVDLIKEIARRRDKQLNRKRRK